MKYEIEKVFIILTLFFGFLYVFILPPFQSVDESNHFFRVWQLSEGKLNAQHNDYGVGDYIPYSISKYSADYQSLIKNIDKKQDIDNIRHDFLRKIEPENVHFQSFVNTSLYSPVCYVSQLAGVILANLFTDNLAIIFYAGRLFNLLIYCLLVFWALRVIPFFKLPLMLLALCPMSLSLGSAYSSDVTVLGLNFLWIAYILKFMTENKSDLNKTIILSVLAFLITLSKSYILLLPLCFLIPLSKYKNLRNYLISIFCIIGSIIFSAVIWCSMSKGLTITMNDGIANSASQIAFIKSNPFAYILILIKTFVIKMPRLIITMIGVLGWQDTKLDWSTYILYPIMVYFAILSDKFKFELVRWQKYVVSTTIIVGVILIFTSLYIMWSPVANPIILGLNGKYFIPLMLPLFLLFKKQEAKYDYNNVIRFIIIALILILFTSELSLLHRFYDITPQLYYKI